MSGVGVAARFARREVRRRPGRTALVTALVAVPVAATALAVVLVRTEPRTALEEWVASSGQADAVRYLDGDADPVAGLPAGSRAVVVRRGYVPVRTADGRRVALEMADLPLDDPLARGMADLVEGRPPTADGEVALTAGAADDLGVAVGGSVDVVRPAATRWWVVGLVEQRHCLTCRTAITAPGGAWLPPPSTTSATALVDLPPGEHAGLPGDGSLQLRSRLLAADSASGEDGTVRWALVVGALALTVAAIVIAAAFAVGARRQLVTIGQLAATGAAPAVVRVALVLQGTFSGLVGVVAGLGLAGGLIAVGREWVERAFDRRIGPWDVRATDLAVVALVGIVAATASALVPAVTAARVPTLHALAGRRPLRPVPRRLTGGGVAAVAGGLALLALAVTGSRSQNDGTLWTLVAIAGGVVELFGACAVAPALVARLEPLAARTSGAWRLAARSLARQRTRSGGVLSAVAAAGALAVAAAALALAQDARTYSHLLPMADDLVVASWADAASPTDGGTLASALDDVAAITGDRDPTPLRTVTHPSTWTVEPIDPEAIFGLGTVPTVADEALLEAFDVPEAARAALREVGAVVLSPGPEGDATIGPAPGERPGGARVPARMVRSDERAGESSLFVSPAVAERLGARVEATGLVWSTGEPLDGDQREALGDLASDLEFDHGGAPPLFLSWHVPPPGPSPVQLELVLAGLALAFSLFVVGTGLALAAAESRDERDVLAAAGAPPSALARVAGAKAWLLTTLGAGLAVPVGFLPVVVGSTTAESDPQVVLPVRTILVLVLVAPIVAAAVSAAVSAAAHVVRPVRVSTTAFE